MAHKFYIKCGDVCQRRIGISLFTLITLLSIVSLFLVLIGISGF